MELERVNDYCWRLPKEGKMRVDGLVYASKKMLDGIRHDESLQQVANVACLPGIVGASLAMPDIHWGYGFPIGGVAAFDMDEGVISPGGVGYDICCLPKYSEIIDCFGCRRPIDSFKLLRNLPKLPCLDNKLLTNAPILLVLEKGSDGKLIRLTTESWKELHATPEHPVMTPEGMKESGEIKQGDKVAAYHFDGVQFEKPSNETIVSEKDIIEIARKMGKGTSGNALSQILNHFKKTGLLPLRYDSPETPRLLRIMGFLSGDGTLYLENESNRVRSAFYGDAPDLESVREDIRAVGFTPSPIYARNRKHNITTAYKRYEFEHHEEYFYVGSAGFGLLMLALGVPMGKKVETTYGVPLWVQKAPLWQRRLYLAALFGAELSLPKTLTGHGYNCYCPTLSMNKIEAFKDNGKLFLGQISGMLSDFGVHTVNISERSELPNKDGKVTIRLRLILSNTYDSLCALYGKVGFEYNAKRRAQAALAVAYLKFKQRNLELRQQLAENISDYSLATGTDGVAVHAMFNRWAPNWQFVERYIINRNASVRVPAGFPTFDDFVMESTAGLGDSGCVWEEVIAKDEVCYEGVVYDFTMNHPAHNFIADGFVVSNCGVRLLGTELTLDDIKPRIREVVNQLFRDIPTGVGAHHRDFKLGPDDMKGVLKDGARWAISRGYGDSSDFAYIEAGGCIAGADPQAVSERAKQRGRDQVGTLGSGNHFVEVQTVDEIYDAQAANVMGLFPGQITVTIHTGSRGLGHQVCEDHIEMMLAASRKYKIDLPDRQLCCAPVNSPEGERYLAAMAAAANFAFANRQMITHWVRMALEHALQMSPADLGITPIYDVCHNIAKFEEHRVGGFSKRLCVHRKGATRAYPAHHPEVPAVYREIGQPVLIPGDMGRYSFVLVGTERAMEETFGSTCHGAGRLMSRHAAKRACAGRNIEHELLDQGIIVRSASRDTVVEEAPFAYKDVADVVDAVHMAGISRKVAKLKPIGVIKG